MMLDGFWCKIEDSLDTLRKYWFGSSKGLPIDS